ncbi:hypothetical protein [Brevibacillus dissolubilis]|uniref:hypothetical protein n=1 Tax=Brevibacillus dissolubilis TaxID=1844116 RepID=UPI0011165E5B|nr:hypothetical protein [Brevibacillus dissolubilis]
MRTLISLIKYLYTVTASPLALLLIWIFNIRPFKYIYDKFHLEIKSSNPEPIIAAIDLAILLLLHNIIWKIVSKLKRPVNIKVTIIDPKDALDEETTKYDFGGQARKLKVKGQVSYKNLFYKRISTLFGIANHVLEIRWNKNWLTVAVDDKRGDIESGKIEGNRWYCDLTALIEKYDIETNIELPIYFSVNNDFIRTGKISARIISGGNIWASIFFSILTAPLVKKELKDRKIVLNKGE